MPCSPNDVSISLPDGPTAPSINGFGNPFALKIPNINPFPSGFPEDILDLFKKFQMIIPPGVLKPTLNPNFSKDIYDAIMKLLDQFFPFLMLYKFFLPVLNLIVCIIEVLCAIPYPRKLVRAIRRLFRNCIPPFLNLFPIFALIIMLISLLLLIISLIEYIVAQIAKLVEVILRNLKALKKAFSEANETGVLAIANKIGSLLCIFQNLFVILSIFAIVIQIIRDILDMSFSIPPCDSGDNNNDDGCCTPDVCPQIVKSSYTRTSGTLQYFNKVTLQKDIGLPAPNFYTSDLRAESWQIFDNDQTLYEEFINIINAHDVTFTPKPIFFPMDGTYNALTSPIQAPYTIDLKMFYNPSSFGRVGNVRNIVFKNCIVTKQTSPTLLQYDNSATSVAKGVLSLAGGLGYEEDGTTVLYGFNTDGYTEVSLQATLENFIHMPSLVSDAPTLNSTDGYAFSNVEYTFKPNFEVLLSKNLVTLGCEPSLEADRVFINNVFAGDAALKFQLLGDILNGTNNSGGIGGNISNTFPDITGAQECLDTSLTLLRNNLTEEGVANFQSMTTICLEKLKSDTSSALNSLIGLGFDSAASNFSITPELQFTTRNIKITANLNDRNNTPLALGLSSDIADSLAKRLKANITFGEVTNFSYDGSSSFNAFITSKSAGKGKVNLSFDNNLFVKNNLSTDLNVSLTREIQEFDYEFILSSDNASVDSGKPRRDFTDLANAGRILNG